MRSSMWIHKKKSSTLRLSTLLCAGRFSIFLFFILFLLFPFYFSGSRFDGLENFCRLHLLKPSDGDKHQCAFSLVCCAEYFKFFIVSGSSRSRSRSSSLSAHEITNDGYWSAPDAFLYISTGRVNVYAFRIRNAYKYAPSFYLINSPSLLAVTFIHANKAQTTKTLRI